MKRLLLTILLGVCLLSGVVCAEQAAAPRPNILFIFADDWGWGDLSAHGNDVYKTPNLDRFAAQGTDFYQFTVGNPVCSPSRTAVMTGHFPARHSVHQHFANVKWNTHAGMPDWLDPNVVTLPRLLKTAGYTTAHFGKWHLTSKKVPDAPLPSAYGYDEAAVYTGPGEHVNHNPNVDQPLPTDKAIDFIRRHQNEPFFVNLWIHATHTPHFPTKRWLDRFQELDERQRVYAAVIAEADERIGQVLQVLDELNLADRTLVVFSSDNGPEVPTKQRPKGDPSNGGGRAGLGTYYSVGQTGGMRGQKRSLYNGGVGVPFLARWPGRTPVGRIDKTTVITAVDLLPTFCAAAGVQLPAGYEPDGENVLPAFEGKPMTRTRPIFWDWRGTGGDLNWPRLAVRDGKWKLLMTFDRRRVELYDIVADRTQSNDLATAHPEVVDRLAEAALAWRQTLPSEPPTNALSQDRSGH